MWSARGSEGLYIAMGGERGWLPEGEPHHGHGVGDLTKVGAGELIAYTTPAAEVLGDAHHPHYTTKGHRVVGKKSNGRRGVTRERFHKESPKALCHWWVRQGDEDGWLHSSHVEKAGVEKSSSKTVPKALVLAKPKTCSEGV